MDPQYIPSRAEKASMTPIENVIGINKASPITDVSPGSAPKTMPRATPIALAIRDCGDIASKNDAMKISIKYSYGRTISNPYTNDNTDNNGTIVEIAKYSIILLRPVIYSEINK